MTTEKSEGREFDPHPGHSSFRLLDVGEGGAKGNNLKFTAPSIPRRSPIQVLTGLDVA